MKQSTKKTIAKEILILFSSVVIIGAIWTVFWTLDKIKISKSENLQSQVKTLTHDIDSIQTSFPKAKTFKDLLTGLLPIEYVNHVQLNIPPPPEIEHGDGRIQNIGQLYTFLATSKFPYSDDSFFPEFPFFHTNIEKELSTDTTKQIFLKRIYSFLKDGKYVNINYNEFVNTIDFYKGLPNITELAAKQKQKDELTLELKTVRGKIYSSNDLSEIPKWIAIIVLSIVYPLRFTYFLILWAVSTLKQK